MEGMAVWNPTEEDRKAKNRWPPMVVAMVCGTVFTALIQIGTWVWFLSQLSLEVNSTATQTQKVLTRLDQIQGRVQNMEATQKDQSVQLNALISHAIENQR